MKSKNAKCRKPGGTRADNLWKLRMEKVVIFGILLCIGTSNGAVVAKECSSESCTLIASRIVENMDPSVNYCDNFYNFACGHFIQSTEIPKDQQSISNDDMLMAELDAGMKSMIASEIKLRDPEPFKVLKKLYKSCINPATGRRQNDGELKNFLKAKGGWPVLEGKSWKDIHFNWRQKLRKFRNDGDALGDFIGLRIDEHPKNKSSKIITLFQPHGFFTPGTEESTFNSSFVEAYHKVLVDLAVALGAEESDASDQLKEAILFEMKLANIKVTDEEIAKLNPFNLMTIRELNKKYPSVPWMENIRTILSSPDFQISIDQTINVPVPEYYVNLEDLISTTLPRIRANYVMSKITLRNAAYSSERLGKIFNDFISSISGMSNVQTREKFCTDQIVGNLWLIFSTMFVKKYSPNNAENSVNQIRNSVKEEFTKAVSQISYLDDTSKKSMVMAADTIKNVSYPNEKDSLTLKNFYKSLVINDESCFFENMNQLSIFDTNLTLRELINPILEDYSALSFQPTSINPSILTFQKYIPISKKLQQILYATDDQPKYISFSTIGTIAGHDIVNALYSNEELDKASYYDECIIEKYENHPTGNLGRKLNGSRTLSENRAEIGGLRLAYDAYTTWTAKETDSLKLPGLEKYTAKQMFWINAASSICTKYTTEGMDNEISNSFQVPAEFRVNIAFANMPEFANDFGCHPRSPMKAKNTCSIW